MSRAFSYFLVLAISLPLGAACGGDDDDVVVVDAGADASAGCVATDVLPLEYHPVATVSAGEVTTTPGEAGVTDAVVDATSLDLPADNAYVYIDLVAGAKADFDDVAALTSSDWDVAFERSSIKCNGGDSGPGQVAVAAVDAASIGDVTEAPADGEFAADDWVSDDCAYQQLPFGEPSTVFGEWYDYDIDSHQLTPKPQIYVVRTHTGDLVKLAITSYYDEGIPATYSVSWAAL